MAPIGAEITAQALVAPVFPFATCHGLRIERLMRRFRHTDSSAGDSEKSALASMKKQLSGAIRAREMINGRRIAAALKSCRAPGGGIAVILIFRAQNAFQRSAGNPCDRNLNRILRRFDIKQVT